jgi:hypothetical protein
VRLGVACDEVALHAANQCAQEHNETWLTLRCLQARAELALAHDDAQDCMKYTDQLLALATGGELQEVIGQAHRLRGMAQLALNEYGSAQTELMHALTLAEQIGCVRLAWESHRALADIAAVRGDVRSKENSAARVSELAEQISESLRGSGLTANFEAEQ